VKCALIEIMVLFVHDDNSHVAKHQYRPSPVGLLLYSVRTSTIAYVIDSHHDKAYSAHILYEHIVASRSRAKYRDSITTRVVMTQCVNVLVLFPLMC